MTEIKLKGTFIEKDSPSTTLRYDPHLDEAIARYEREVAARQPEIDRIESERTKAVGEMDALVDALQRKDVAERLARM